MMTPTLESPRLALRPFAPEDWEAINAMLSDTEAMEYMHFTSWNDDQRREWFDACVSRVGQSTTDALEWVIAKKDTDDVIGWFGIGATDTPTTTYDISFGYALARPYWNHGYMTEALRTIFAYEFDTLGVPRLSANCRAANVASARVTEKAGMRREKSDYGADFEGNWSHRHHYIMTKAEWHEARNERSCH